MQSVNQTDIINELRSRGREAERFVNELIATQRKGVETTICELKEWGFFKAPASTAFHLNRPGGLLTHSLNTYDMGLMLREQTVAMFPQLAERLPKSSVAISTLLHDTCKAEIYKKAIKSRRNKEGNWEKYSGYDVDYSAFPLGHGEKSVIQLLRWDLELTDDEIMAIRWHMTAWDLPFQSPEQRKNLALARSKCPLCIIVQCADGLASGITETIKE